MSELGVIGVNSKSCPLPIRETLTQAMAKCFGKNSYDRFMFPYVLLSTCHRVEMYFSGSDIAAIHVYILSNLRQEISESFEPFLYSFFEADVFLHLAKVTCGLDSAILGESEIQRQVKISYEQAKAQQELSWNLHYLFQKSLQLGKNMRSSYDKWKRDFSLEDLILEKIYTTIENPQQQKVLLIGNSETNRKLMRMLVSKGFCKITVVSRNPFHELLQQPSIQSLSRQHLSNWDQYPVVISATNELNPLLQTSSDTQRLVIDLSLPRTIQPSAANLSKTQLFNIEDLGSLFMIKKENYKKEIFAVEKKVKDKIKQRYEAYLAKYTKKGLYPSYQKIELTPSLIEKKKAALF
jgi:glutamyl-tRNA reductase